MAGLQFRDSAGGAHSLVLTEAGAVLSFGHGVDGCLGHGDDEDQRTPKVIEALRGERVVAVSAGNVHSLVLTEAGAVLSFGHGDDGRLGHGDEETRQDADADRGAARGAGERVVAMSAGEHHSSLVLTKARVVLSFGDGALVWAGLEWTVGTQ